MSIAPGVHTIRGYGVLLGLLTFAVLAAPTASRASTIVWSRYDKNFTRQQIVAARPDGSRLRAISHPKKGGSDIDAQISPNGRRVVYERDFFDESIPPEIHLAGISGKNRRQLDLGCVDPCVLDTAPTWLNGGGRLAYSPVIGPFDKVNGSATSAVLHTSRLDGSGFRRLSEPGIDGVYEDYHAHFSPDGSYLVFVRVRNSDIKGAIFRMDADGSHLRRLTPWGLGADLPDLSPAASGPTKDLVVFETFAFAGGAPKGSSNNVATVPTTCLTPRKCRGKIRYLTRHGDRPDQSFNPSWSPNGRRVAYTRFNPGDKHTPAVGDIWTMDPNGGHKRAVSTSPLFEYRPDWGRSPTR